ncbi:Gfo/Idh/MocA family protein [Verrucomicrobiota bacterium]
MPKNFAITGVAGYVAPRHLLAIKDTGNRLVAAVDPHDSVGILDRHFFDVAYFREFERFDRHIDKLRRSNSGEKVDYVSICSPNYLHDAHIRFALREAADAICEKPLVLNPWNCDALQELEKESGKKVYTVLQLRLHPTVRALKEKFSTGNTKHEVELKYITSRGKWYLYSWKSDLEQSGGLATNIGIHFFDMLMWIFGPRVGSEVHTAGPTRTAGELELERANVRWQLSIDRSDLPEVCGKDGQTTYRSITIDGEEVEFSGGFTDLHTKVYENILAGGGFGIEDARPSIELVQRIREQSG